MSDIDSDDVVFEAELVEDDAVREIAKAIGARHSIARKYVMRLRRRNPEATPAEIIRILERHYTTSISTAGAVIAAGAIAANIDISLIPLGGAAASGAKAAGQHAAKQAGKQVAKSAAKEAAKAAAKGMALGVATTGAQRVVALIPAGDQQLQFEITAVFALAIADIHGMNLDHDQAFTLVYGLSNERVGQEQIAIMAADVATVSTDNTVSLSKSIADGREDWSHWANTLADTLPAGAAQSLVRTIQTGQLDTVRAGLSGKQQAAVEYGVGAVVGGVARFVFGRDVVAASRAAFTPAPDVFPAHLIVPEKEVLEDDVDSEPNRAIAALEEAAKSTGTWITGTATSIGGGVANTAVAASTGVATAAGTVGRSFQSIDIDGDGIPDEPRALTAVKGAGSAIAGAAGSVGGGVAGLFKSKKKPANTMELTEQNDSSGEH
ncbi:hypothetical protein [Subtercola frigoramans]|uniref:Uncharacterized protein n=1 Tax=Subtercola frigoramans TaxID=120298 RepID=A0ABS2L7T5_9MICO|nr:hypothetical protein [Subtercola frigoramans]MBM7473129.1 hypothetical protein [Subtercola frigoramans]